MARDGAGVYSLPPGYQAVSGEVIQPSQHNPPLEDLAAAMTDSISRNGVTAVTANIPMAGFKFTGHGDATSGADVLNRQTADARYVNGEEGRDYVIDRQVAAAAASVEMTLPAGFDAFELVIIDYIGSIAIDLSLRISFDGTTFDSTSTYLTTTCFALAGIAPSPPIDTTTSYFRFLTVDPPTSDTTKSSGRHLITPGGSGQSFRMEGYSGGFSSGNAAMTQYRTSCVKQSASGRAQKILLFSPGGLASGTFVLKGIGA
jgi:hypothetical protein